MSDVDTLLLVGGLAWGLGGAVFGFTRWYRSATSRSLRALRSARPVWIADAPEGETVRIEGRVLEGATTRAPLSQQECVYAISVAVDVDGDGDETELVREAHGAPFAIDDGTGRAIVDLTGSICELAVEELGVGFDNNPRARALLERHGQLRPGADSRDLTYRELLIRVGDRVSILCRPTREPDPDLDGPRTERGYRDAPPTRLRISGSEKHPVVLGATPKYLWPYPRQPPRPA